jgi:DNA-binding NtrC family response regulator
LMNTRSKALIVDDDADIAELVTLVVAKQGKLEPGSTSSASQAMEMMAGQDVLITDFNLRSSVDGTDLARHFKRLNPHGFVILLTGSEHIVSTLVDIVLKKPASAEQIRQAAAKAHRVVNLPVTNARLTARSNIAVERSKLLFEMAATAHARAASLITRRAARHA